MKGNDVSSLRGQLPEGVLSALHAANDARRHGRFEEAIERQLDADFGAHHRLAVYGSLAPGRANHGQLSSLGGEWSSDLFVHGEMVSSGWGAGIGFPAMRWRLHAEPIAVFLFVSPELESHWDRLDAFEGRDYARILVPVFGAAGFSCVANLYEAR